MKHYLAILALMTAFAGSPAIAITFTDSNTYGIEGAGQLINSPTGFTDSFNIVTSSGYDPVTQHVVSAKTIFSLWDANDGSTEDVSIDLGTLVDWKTGTSFSGTISFISFPVPISGLVLIDLSADGILNYTVAADTGSFYFQSATLSGVFENNGPAPSVPEGGSTMALLGLSLGALSMARRKMAI